MIRLRDIADDLQKAKRTCIRGQRKYEKWGRRCESYAQDVHNLTTQLENKAAELIQRSWRRFLQIKDMARKTYTTVNSRTRPVVDDMYVYGTNKPFTVVVGDTWWRVERNKDLKMWKYTMSERGGMSMDPYGIAFHDLDMVCGKAYNTCNTFTDAEVRRCMLVYVPMCGWVPWASVLKAPGKYESHARDQATLTITAFWRHARYDPRCALAKKIVAAKVGEHGTRIIPSVEDAFPMTDEELILVRSADKNPEMCSQIELGMMYATHQSKFVPCTSSPFYVFFKYGVYISACMMNMIPYRLYRPHRKLRVGRWGEFDV